MPWKTPDQFAAAVRKVFPSARHQDEGSAESVEHSAQRSADRPAKPYLDNCTHESIGPGPGNRPVVPTSSGASAPWGGEYTELTLVRLRDGSVDVSIIERPHWYRPPKHRPSWNRELRGTERKQSMTQEDRKRSAARAKAAIKRASCQLQADRLLTLTFRDNVTDADLAWDVFAEFRKFYRAALPYEFRIEHQRYRVESLDYVVVPEPQQRGAIHFHLALNRPHDINRIRKAWQRAQAVCGLPSPDGNVNIKRKFSKRPGGTSSRGCARYLAKYIDKFLQGGIMWRKRYSCSKGIPEPITEHFYFMDVYSTAELLEFAASVCGAVRPGRPWSAKVGPFNAEFATLMPP